MHKEISLDVWLDGQYAHTIHGLGWRDLLSWARLGRDVYGRRVRFVGRAR